MNSNNLARSVLYLLVTRQLIALRFVFVCDATVQLSALHDFVFASDTVVKLQLGALRFVFYVQPHRTSLCFAFPCTVTT